MLGTQFALGNGGMIGGFWLTLGIRTFGFGVGSLGFGRENRNANRNAHIWACFATQLAAGTTAFFATQLVAGTTVFVATHRAPRATKPQNRPSGSTAIVGAFATYA